MSDGKRRRFRKPKERSIMVERTAPQTEIQPKFILKPRPEREVNESRLNVEPSTSTEAAAAASTHSVQKTIIVTRSDAPQSPSMLAGSPNTTQEAANNDKAHQVAEPVIIMNRPTTMLTAGNLNPASRKLLIRANSDFLVVGVLGTQGVGKSTILNLLANEHYEYPYYEKVFLEQDAIFPTKLKASKFPSRSRTETLQMFITSDRIFLLDTPAVLCNTFNRELTEYELDDLHTVITILSVCHLLIVVQDDYFNLSLMRLLRFAELIKPTEENHPFGSDYFPNVLFLKNRAKRHDFVPGEKERNDKMLRALFKDSQLRIFVGQTIEHQRQRKPRISEAEREVNSFYVPEVKGSEATTYHGPLIDIIRDLRAWVFKTPRNTILAGSSELTEIIWFELLTKVSQDTQHFFYNTYKDIYRHHLETHSVGNNNGWQEL